MAEGRRIQNLMAGGPNQQRREYVEKYVKPKEPAALNGLKSETSPFTTCTGPLGSAREVKSLETLQTSTSNSSCSR